MTSFQRYSLGQDGLLVTGCDKRSMHSVKVRELRVRGPAQLLYVGTWSNLVAECSLKLVLSVLCVALLLFCYLLGI